MPGIPKTKGCLACKARKIKCDEKWPSCTSCQRSKRTCPGPAPLVSVAYRSPRLAIQESEKKRLPLLHSVVTPTDACRPHASHPHRQVRRSNTSRARLPVPKSQDPICHPVRANPMTNSGLLASRVVSMLNVSIEQGDFTALNLLSFIPQRLHESQCLHDSVAFWCCSQMDDRRLLTKPSVTTLQSYSKALQSLQQALASKSAYFPETLAAAVLLQRTGPSFEKTVRPDSATHAKGISALVVQRGPPRLEDDLDASLANELSSILFCWHSHKSGNHCSSESMHALSEEPDTQDPPISVSEEALIESMFGKMVDRIPDIRLIHDNPLSKEMKSMSSDLRDRIQLWNREFSQVVSQIKERFIKRGLIKIIPDANFFVGTRYYVGSIFVTQFLVEVLVLNIIIAKILHNFSVLYNDPDESALYKEYRDFSIQFWMLIPHLDTLDLKTSQVISCTFSLTFEAAEEAYEKDQILNAAMKYDFYLCRLRHNRALLEERVLRIAKQLTGRAEILPIQVWISTQREPKVSENPKETSSDAYQRPSCSHILHGCLFFERLIGRR